MWKWEICRMVAGEISVLAEFSYADKTKAEECLRKYLNKKTVGHYFKRLNMERKAYV